MCPCGHCVVVNIDRCLIFIRGFVQRNVATLYYTTGFPTGVSTSKFSIYVIRILLLEVDVCKTCTPNDMGNVSFPPHFLG